VGVLSNFPWSGAAEAESAVRGVAAAGLQGLQLRPVGATPAAEGGTLAAPADAAGLLLQQQLDAARAELEALRISTQHDLRMAHQKGFEEGQQAREEQVGTELTGMRQQIAQSLAEAARARQELLAQTDLDLVRLSMAIAEKVLYRQLQIDSDALQGIVHAALERLAGRPTHAVRMHPEDMAPVEAALARLQHKSFRLLPDPSLPKGSLLFDTDHGVLDCSITTQLEEIERGLADRLQRSTS
jgi:flagellar biosynthesis/type III secretory pathway protein FliH